MEENFCVSCKTDLVSHKKRRLCNRCYHKFWKKNQLSALPIHPLIPLHHNLLNSEIKTEPFHRHLIKEQNKAEILFAQNNPKVIYQPALFRLSGRTGYAPDFYDPQQNRFIEIIGSRQRYHQLIPKLGEFRKKFPKIKLDILCGNGKLYHSTKNLEEEVNGDTIY